MQKKSVLSPSNLGLEDEMINLHQSINSLLPDSQKKVLQFIGTRPREGTSTIVKEFAIVSVMKFGKTTLLLNASAQESFFDMKPNYSLEEAVLEDEPVDKAIFQIADSPLYVCHLFMSSEITPKCFGATGPDDCSGIDVILKKLTQRFDFILIDSPPGGTFSTSLAISSQISGVVLVVEAEKTRWPVVDNVKDTILKNGGKILGIVFNKRRYHIPNIVYKFL